VFVDVEADTCNIDVSLMAGKLTAKTRAIMPVSLYGQVADMASINAFAQAHGLAVIEDGAQSFGALYQGRRSCALSSFGATSFFPSKPLGCYGDGGALFTDDERLAQAAREIRVHGQSRRYHHTRVGVGGRMDTLQCAVVLGKLERFEWELQQREALAQRYSAGLRGAAGIGLPTVRADRQSAWAQYTVMVAQRDAVAAALKAQGIPTAVHYPIPLHHQPAYAALCCPECCPVSDRVAAQVLSLPMSADLSVADQDRVITTLRQVVQGLQ
jgi:UDP-2-acetamido-2-deoxy-ribo-hexuluronate aminotransferase